MKMANDVIKKLFCDEMVVTVAQLNSELAREGNLEPWQLSALIQLDSDYIAKSIAISSGEDAPDGEDTDTPVPAILRGYKN